MSCCCQIISQDDFKCLIPISQDLDYENLLPFIQRAWDQDISKILCKDLAEYIDETVCGGEPDADDTALIEKIKAPMVFATMTRFLLWHPNNITRFGIVAKQSTESDPSDKEERDRMIRDCENALTDYTAKLVTYLNNLDPNGKLGQLYKAGCGECGTKQELPNNAIKIGVI